MQLIYTSTSSLEQQVTQVWQQFYHRAPSPTELASYTHYLAQVGDREGLSIIVASSLAYYQQAGSNPAQWLRNLYQDYFNTPQSAINPGTFNYYLGQITSGRMSRAEVAKALD